MLFLQPWTKLQTILFLSKKKYCISNFLAEVFPSKSKSKINSKATHSIDEIIQANVKYCKSFHLNILELDKSLPIMYWLPKMHETPE